MIFNNQQLRIATLGDFSGYYSAFLYGTMEGTIANGAWFRPIDLFKSDIPSIESQINFFKPHILFCHCIFNEKGPVNRDALFEMLRKVKKSGVVILYHQGDARTTPRFSGNVSEFISGALVNHSMLNEFSDIWKIPCIQWPYGCFIQESLPDFKNSELICDVAFTGALSDISGHVHYERSQFINDLKQGTNLKIKTFPNEFIGNTRFFTPELCASAFVQLGVQMALHIPGYLDVRPFQYIGAGGLYFHDSDLGCFTPGTHYIQYEKGSVESFVKQFNYYKDHPEQAKTIRIKGWGYAQIYHSTQVRMREAIDFARRIS